MTRRTGKTARPAPHTARALPSTPAPVRTGERAAAPVTASCAHSTSGEVLFLRVSGGTAMTSFALRGGLMAMLLVVGLTDARAQELGTISFPTSGAAAAQPAFL